MTVSGYNTEEWQPTRWHVYLCDIQGYPQEELLDVEFTVEQTLNQIAACTVSATGKKFGYFKPWLHTIAVTGDNREDVMFFGPVLNTRAQVAKQAEYSITTELDCQGWEAWLDRVYPMVEFFSEPGGADDKSAWAAVSAIWDGVEAREKRFQVHHGGAIQRPKSTIDAKISVTLDWDTVSEEARPGAPSAWAMHQEIHAQGIDVTYRPTWDAVGGRYYSRCVIGGSTNPIKEQMAYPKTGRTLQREFVIGADASTMSLELRGDMQATSVLATGVDSAYGLAPTYGTGSTALSLEDAALSEATFPKDVFAGLLLEYQYPAEIKTTNADDPEAMCKVIAAAQRERLRRTPLLMSDVQIRWQPGDVMLGDIIKVTDNGGAQIIDVENATQLTRWEVTGRVSALSVASTDMLHATVTIFEVNDPNSEFTGFRSFEDTPPEETSRTVAINRAAQTELSNSNKATLSPVSFEQSMDNLVVDVERLLLQRNLSAAGGGVPAGSVLAYTGDTIPDGWLACYGQIVDRVQYAPLFTAIGTKYGVGNGATTFGLPDLRSKFILGAGGAGYSPLGNVGGSDTISVNQMPGHTHGVAHTHKLFVPQSAEHKHDVAATTWARRYAVYPGSVEAPGGAAAPTNASWGSGLAPAANANERYTNGTHPAGAHTHSSDGILTTSATPADNRLVTDSTGSGQQFLPPYYALYYIIKAT